MVLGPLCVGILPQALDVESSDQARGRGTRAAKPLRGPPTRPSFVRVQDDLTSHRHALVPRLPTSLRIRILTFVGSLITILATGIPPCLWGF
jgi:hypothetical protein